MNTTKWIAVKDDSKFCVCGKAKVSGWCPICDPQVPANALGTKQVVPAKPWQPKQKIQLRSIGFGKYDYC